MAVVLAQRSEPGTGTAGGGAALAVERDRAFARAVRHSRKVRTLKLVLPVLAIAAAAAFFGVTYLRSPTEMIVQTEVQSVEDGKIVMSNPQLNGVTKDQRAYTMTAARAIQDLARQTMIELEKIDARLPYDDEGWASIQAERGIYDSETNTLDLPNPISVRSDNGLEATLESAFIDVGKGELTTTRPVEIRLEGSRITSEGMQVVDNGKVLIFEKQVRVTIDPQRYRQVQAEGNPQNVQQ